MSGGWSKRKPKRKFKPGDRVKLSKEFIDAYPGDYQHQKSLEFYGDGTFIVYLSMIEPGGEIDDGDEGRWWGGEMVIIYKIINGKKHFKTWAINGDRFWKETETPHQFNTMGGWCLTKV